MNVVHLARKFALFAEYWSSKMVGELNGPQVKVAQRHGECVWHQHDNDV